MVTLETGGAQQVDKRRDNQLSFLICDSKLDKPVNDLTLKLLRTRVEGGPEDNGNIIFKNWGKSVKAAMLIPRLL